MLAIVEGQPQVLSIRDILRHFLDHRREVVTRRSQFELREARKRFNVVFGSARGNRRDRPYCRNHPRRARSSHSERTTDGRRAHHDAGIYGRVQ